ncbi:MAG: sortase [bacterium]
MIRLYKILTGLLAFVFIVVLGYFIGYPLLPKIIDLKNSIYDFSPYEIGFQSSMGLFMELTEPKYDNSDFTNTVEFVPENVEIANLEKMNTTIEIPSISVKGEIVDGQSQEEMLRGFWHHPLSDVPGKRGNVVIFGHRFDKVPPNPQTFFNLDKIDVGDLIKIRQDDRDLEYKVIKVYETEKDNQQIFSNMSDYQLTLVTCTPLWTSDRRLVVIAIQTWVSSVI